MADVELKPCPFCGGKVEPFKDDHNKFGIECSNCQMYFGIEVEAGCKLIEGWHSTFNTLDSMIEAWNRRAETKGGD